MKHPKPEPTAGDEPLELGAPDTIPTWVAAQSREAQLWEMLERAEEIAWFFNGDPNSTPDQDTVLGKFLVDFAELKKKAGRT